MKRIIVGITGNIGVGKTTLVKSLNKKLGSSQSVVEDALKNPYIDDFYKDMRKWAFTSRIPFLYDKIESYAEIDETKQFILFDRTYHDSFILAKHQFDLGNMDERDFSTYSRLFHAVEKFIPKTDILVYLYCSPAKSLERVKSRNSPYEQGVTVEYLSHLKKEYDRWIEITYYPNIIKVNTENGMDIDNIVSKLQSITIN